MVEVRLLNQSNTLIPGGQGTGSLPVATPIKASVSADPILAPPGNSTVSTAIKVEPRFAVGSGSSVGLEATDPSKDRINWAAASRGTTISTSSPLNANVPASNLINEQRSGTEHYLGTAWHANGFFLLDLSAVRSIDTLEFHIWDGDARVTRYRVESSTDGVSFSTLTDKTTGEHSGFQRLTFPATAMRYIKIIGTFDSVDGTYFYLTDEIFAIGDSSASPVPTQTVTVDGAVNSANNNPAVGQIVELNAGIYEIKHKSGAVSFYPNDSDNNGKTWGFKVNVNALVVNKAYQLGYIHDTLSLYATQGEAATAALGKSFKLYLPFHTKVSFWIHDPEPSGNRGTETVEIRQLSGPNDSLPVRVRDAMMRSVLWEQPEVAGWRGFGSNKWIETANYDCFGCHVQTQGSVGLETSRQKLPELPVEQPLMERFVDAYIGWQNTDGSISSFNSAWITQTSLAAWAMARFTGAQLDRLGATLLRALDFLLTKQQSDGSWNADHTDFNGSRLYFDGTPSATHTAGNIQALAKALDYVQGKSFLASPSTVATVTGNQVTFPQNPGTVFEVGFTPIANVTGVRITISDTFSNFNNGNFVISELEAFNGADQKTIASATANFEQNGYPVSESFNGTKNDPGDGWAYFPQDTRVTPARAVWVFGSPVVLDHLRITQIYPSHQLKKFTLEFTTDSAPTLTSSFNSVAGLQVGVSASERISAYRAALGKAAGALASPSFSFTRNTRTAAQTIIGLNAALPFLSGSAATAAQTRITQADTFLRNAQHDDGGWKDDPNDATDIPRALQTAEALEALLLVTQSSVDPAIVAGAEFLLRTQLSEGSWQQPAGLQRRLASTTWVEIALPTIFENLSALTVDVDHLVPTGTGVSPVNGSFTPPLDSQQNGGGQSTLHWDALVGSTGQSFTFNAQLQNMQPGEVRRISNGTMVNFTSVAGQGTVELPELFVSAKHILSLDPPTRTVQAGNTASFTVTLENLLGATESFNLTVDGVPASSVTFPETATLNAGEKKTLTLLIDVPVDTVGGEYGFRVGARSMSGVADFVSGSVNVTEVSGGGGEPQPVTLGTLAVDVALVPSQKIAGRGTATVYVVRVTNVGDETDTYTLEKTLPNGFTGQFAEAMVTVPPGLGNFRDVELAVTPPAGASAGDQHFTVRAVSKKKSSVQDEASGVVTVVGQGVSVTITPSSRGPGGSFQLTVKNVGTAQDTFDLTLGGPVGVVSTLSTNAVTLAPNASQAVTVTVGAINFAFPGSLELVGTATSRGNTAVQDSDTAVVHIGQAKGLNAAFTPALVELPTPGAATFLLVVNNVGNGEDAYSAEIMNTSGPVTAALSGVNRQLTQKVELFRLLGLSQGGIVLSATLSAAGEGKVTVKVTSLTDTSLTAQAVATVRTAGASSNHPPVVEAGPNQTATLGQTISLSAIFTDADTADTHTATVKWGDGVQTGATVTESTGSGTVVASHSYSQAKSYPVEVCVMDNHDAQSCDTFTVEVKNQATCGVCTEPAVVVDRVLELDAAKLAQTAGVLAPFASFDGQTITIDLGSRPLVVTSTGRISVPADPKLHPAAFHNAGNDSSPHLVIRSSCTLTVAETPAKKVKTQTRSLTGVIETVGNGGRGGDLTLAFDAGIIINGRVQSVQEKQPDDPRSISGAVTLQSQCGSIELGPAAWVVSWGDKGSGAVTVRQGGEGEVVINGLVMNRMNKQAQGGTRIPTINVEAAGKVIIDGSHLVLDEWTVEGTRLDVTSGLLTLSREPAITGQIKVQAQGDITVTRDVRGVKLNRRNYGAVATVVEAATPQGGEIQLRSLAGKIVLRDRAVQAEGKRDNSVALIEVIADQDVVLQSPSGVDGQHQPTVTTAAAPVNNVGKGGENLLQSCDGSVRVEANGQVLATGKSLPGRNELTAARGSVVVQGKVEPAPVTGTPCTDPPPLF
jgi:hypothetical protein